MTGPSANKYQTRRLRHYVALLALSCAAFSALTGAWATVNGDEEHSLEKYAVRRVQAAYPPNAQKYRIEGTVTVHVTVSPEGKVARAEFIRGNNVFRSVSLDAAKRWVFKIPSQENNQGMIHFTFKLNG